MSTTMQGRYIGHKKIELVHPLSGTKLISVAPPDNNGDGSSFSPTDLLATSLPACILTIMSIIAENKSIDITGSHFTVTKEMSQNPRRVKKISITFFLPKNLTEAEKQKLLPAIDTCPVHHSLHPDVELDIKINYEV